MPRAPRILMTPQWLEAQRAAAKADPSIRVEYGDAEVRGLKLELRDGRLTWSLRYYTPAGHRRFPLGEYPAVKLGQARKDAEKAKGQEDPQAARRQERAAARKRRIGETLSGAIAAWLEDRKRGPAAIWKGGLDGGSARSFLPHIRALDRTHGARKLEDVEPRTLAAFLDEPAAVATRNRRLQAVRTLWKWAGRRFELPASTSPVHGVTKEKGETERDRVLSEDELRAMVRGFDATRYGRALRFIALTGVRREEVLAAEWKWVDLDAGVMTVPRDADKSGKVRGEPRRVALCSKAVELLSKQRAANFAEGLSKSPYVFPTSTGERPHRDAFKPILSRLRGLRSNGTAPSKDKRAKVRTPALPMDVTIHDVRRTCSNWCLQAGADLWIVDYCILGHVRPKLHRTYMPVLPLGEARAILEKWSAELDRILSDQKIVPSGFDISLIARKSIG